MQNYRQTIKEIFCLKQLNCATTTVIIMSKHFSTKIQSQVIDSLVGLPNGAEQKSLCGLVSGTLIFIGIYGKIKKLKRDQIKNICKKFSSEFIGKFGSIDCKDLKPEKISPEQTCICKELAYKAIDFSIDFIEKSIKDVI